MFDEKELAKYKLIFLVGFMGSGKSTLGPELAHSLQYTFLESDALIAQKENRTVAAIFAEKGEAYFRKQEHELVLQFPLLEHCVIATGGGMPCVPGHMELLNQMGCTIYLKENADILFSRLQHEKEKRPLLHGLNDAQLKHFITEKLSERAPFYTQATFTLH